MKHILVKATINYADEFDCKMFGVFTEKKWEENCAIAKEYFEERGGSVELYFGTNEAIEFESYDAWFKKMKTTEISADEAKFLRKHFDESFGTGSRVISPGS